MHPRHPLAVVTDSPSGGSSSACALTGVADHDVGLDDVGVVAHGRNGHGAILVGLRLQSVGREGSGLPAQPPCRAWGWLCYCSSAVGSQLLS